MQSESDVLSNKVWVTRQAFYSNEKSKFVGQNSMSNGQKHIQKTNKGMKYGINAPYQ